MPITARSLANAVASTDNANVGVGNRGSKYGEQFVMPTFCTSHGLADEGSYFVATNPTPGTAILYPLTTAFADTTPAIYLFNGAAAGGKSVYLDYIKWIVTTVPASTTQVYYAIKADTVARSLTTDNTTALTPVNANMGATGASILNPLKIQNSATASVIAAASAGAKLLARGALGGLPILGDALVISFGGNTSGAFAGSGTSSRRVAVSAPLVVGPQQSLVVHLWEVGAAVTAMQYEFEMGWSER